MAGVILILGGEDDEHAQHMLGYLRQRGHDAELLDSRWFPGQMAISFVPGLLGGSLELPIGRRLLLPQQVGSVYWRTYYGIGAPPLPDPEQAFIAENDARSLFESLLITLPVRWVNGWEAFQLHQTKPVQLARIAQRLNLVRTPATALTNDPQQVRDFAERWPRAIVKPVQGGDHAARLTPEHLRKQNLNNLELAPITVQEEIVGTNIRVFVAGERVMACEVRTPELDYRTDPEPDLLVHELSPAMQAISRRIAEELKLVWTGIDYRLTPEGEYVFLEANPSPMFLGFERATGLPLTESLAALLTDAA